MGYMDVHSIDNKMNRSTVSANESGLSFPFPTIENWLHDRQFLPCLKPVAHPALFKIIVHPAALLTIVLKRSIAHILIC